MQLPIRFITAFKAMILMIMSAQFIISSPLHAKDSPYQPVVVFFSQSVKLEDFSKQWKIKPLRPLKNVDAHVFIALKEDIKSGLIEKLNQSSDVDAAFEDRIVEGIITTNSFQPNDEYYYPGSWIHDNEVMSWDGQWYVKTTKVDQVWLQGFTGKGVLTSVLDTGVEFKHPDLEANYVADYSYDFFCTGALFQPEPEYWNCSGDNIPLPNLEYRKDYHGTAVAGITSASGGNSIGISGVAPNSKFSAIRILGKYESEGMTESQMANAHLFGSNKKASKVHIKNNSYSNGKIYHFSPIENYAIKRSTQAGTIHVFSAGNDRPTKNDNPFQSHVEGDAGKGSYSSLPDVISVAASDARGKYSNYSNYGSNITVTAPSGSSSSSLKIMTTDLTDQLTGTEEGRHTYEGQLPIPNPAYNSQFSGTSAAAPIVSGILALIKQAQPKLNTRMAKHLLARTSDMVDPNDASVSSNGGWQRNAAGIYFNPNYGFGRINAAKLLDKAQKVKEMSSLKTIQTSPVSMQASIPGCYVNLIVLPGSQVDCPVSTTHFIIKNTKSLPIETVQVQLDIAHDLRKILSIDLISPSGTRSKLLYPSTLDNSNEGIQWTFLSNAFWGENPYGDWRLDIYETVPHLRIQDFHGRIRDAKLIVNTGDIKFSECAQLPFSC